MIVKLLTEHHLEFLSLKEEAQTRLSLHLSKCQIVGNLMPRLNYTFELMLNVQKHFSVKFGHFSLGHISWGEKVLSSVYAKAQ